MSLVCAGAKNKEENELPIIWGYVFDLNTTKSLKALNLSEILNNKFVSTKIKPTLISIINKNKTAYDDSAKKAIRSCIEEDIQFYLAKDQLRIFYRNSLEVSTGKKTTLGFGIYYTNESMFKLNFNKQRRQDENKF